MVKDFSKLLIKEYTHWIVYVHENQGYLGRCIVWCKRENAQDLTDTTQEEQIELFFILDKLRKTLTKVFKPDWLNYAFLGNNIRHLHCHLIPRYATHKEFMGVKFEDKLYGHNYKTDKSFKTSDELLQSVRDSICGEL